MDFKDKIAVRLPDRYYNFKYLVEYEYYVLWKIYLLAKIFLIYEIFFFV